MSTPLPTPPFFDVRMRGFTAKTAVDDVVALIRKRTSKLGPEVIALDAAAGRVLATDVIATVPVPHFDRAAFDGYALRASETSNAGTEFRIVGEALPGRPFGRAIEAGEAVRIMTGSPMPAGADAVLPAEHAQESGDLLRVGEPVTPGKNVGH